MPVKRADQPAWYKALSAMQEKKAHRTALSSYWDVLRPLARARDGGLPQPSANEEAAGQLVPALLGSEKFGMTDVDLCYRTIS